MKHNLKVAHSFSKGAKAYDHKAFVQAHVNDQLYHLALSHEKHLKECTTLELGCGTGGLSEQLAPLCGPYIVSDISPAMVHAACRRAPSCPPVVVDAENPCFTASFDIIISSLTLHWLQDPKKGLQQLLGCLKPGGRLYLSTMGANSFYEWRTAHTALDAPCGTPDFIPIGALKSWLPPQGERNVSEEWIVQKIENPISHFKSLKNIGAGLSHPSHKPLPFPIFRKVLDKFSETKKLSYQILYAIYQKPLESVEE